MPPTNKKNKSATSKMTTKNLDEKETPFEPVPYETTDICTSIKLLGSTEKELVLRALWVLAKYADTKAANVEFLYKNGIVPVLLELVGYSELTITRFTLKLLAQIVTIVPAASQELSLDRYHSEVKQINHLFMTLNDSFVKEFSTQILSQVVKDPLMASCLFRAGVVAPIFNVLKTSQDADVQLNTLTFFSTILESREASYVLPMTAEFSAKTILCFLKSKLPEIRDAALAIIDKLTSWKSDPMQQLLKQERVVEALFKVILNDEFKAMHKKTFSIIHTCMQCLATASYFVHSLEFVQFCQWAKTCPKRYILPSATIIASLTKVIELRQVLFDFSTEDTILSFFRINSELVFYKTCEALSHMTSHRFCCQKMVTPVVVQSILSMLSRSNIPIIPYHEIALTTLYNLMKRDNRTIKLIVACGGIIPLTECWLKDKQEYSHTGLSTLMGMLYMFSANADFRRTMMNSMMYEMLLNTFDDSSDFSRSALLVLNQYVDDPECRQYFIDFNGPKIVLKQITSTPNEKTFKDVLIFLQRLFLYKRLGMAFLMAGCVPILNSVCDEAKESIPLVNQLITMMYDLYLPIKFYQLGRLEITDHFNSRFYLIKGAWDDDFPFLEVLEKQEIVPVNTLYVVDFSANVAELTQKQVKHPSPVSSLSSISTTKTNTTIRSRDSKTAKSPSSHRRTSILKTGSSLKSQKVSIQLNESTLLSEEPKQRPSIYLTCQVPPPIDFGYVSKDPYLPKYLEKLKLLMYNNKKYAMCFRHQVKLVARFVEDLLSGPDGIDDTLDLHCFDVHLECLKAKLGTTIIPVGYLRCGSHCEKALLFKALAEKVGVPASLVKGTIEGQNNLMYWNEVPLIDEETYAKVDDEQKTYLAYCVVDLVKEVGNLMLVGGLEANKYCGLVVDESSKFTDFRKLDSDVNLNDPEL